MNLYISHINQLHKSTMRDKMYHGRTLQTRRIKKPNNYLSMIDRFAENGLKYISIFPNKRYHHNNIEELCNVTLQKQLYAIVLNLPYS